MNTFEIIPDHHLYEEAVTLRYELFFRDFGLPKEITCDDHEPTSRHFVTSKEYELIAYARLTHTGDDVYRISQVVVRPERQRKGFGREILSHVINAARESGAKHIYLNSQTSVKGLYEGLGFKPEGEEYQVKLTGVPHVKMVMAK